MTLPNFLIVGAAKAGTTSLYNYLSEHPEVYMSPIKETNYFAFSDPLQTIAHTSADHRFSIELKVRTLAEYEALFDGVTIEKAVGEASPSYLESPIAPEKIHACIPDAKIVISLRNPADRAYSAYLMALRNGRVKGTAEATLTTGSHFVLTGFYYEQVLRYIKFFGYENTFIMLFEDMKTDVQNILRRLFEFLNIDDHFRPNIRRLHNVGGVPRNPVLNSILANKTLKRIAKPLVTARGRDWVKDIYAKNLDPAPPLPTELRRRLIELFRDDIQKLQALIDRDLSSWLEVDGVDNGKVRQ